MSENIRSELFFLKQFGFNDILLEHVFFLGVDPIQVIFDSKHLLHWELENIFRSEEHTSELQSRGHLVCRLLLEKKKPTTTAKKHCDGRHEELSNRGHR